MAELGGNLVGLITAGRAPALQASEKSLNALSPLLFAFVDNNLGHLPFCSKANPNVPRRSKAQ